MSGNPYLGRVKEIQEARTARFPSGRDKDKLVAVLASVSLYMQALLEAEIARDFETFDMPKRGKQEAGVGCRCVLDNGVAIVAHCLLPFDDKGQALLRVGREHGTRSIDPNRVVQSRYPAFDPNDHRWPTTFERPIAFITTEASEPPQG